MSFSLLTSIWACGDDDAATLSDAASGSDAGASFDGASGDAGASSDAAIGGLDGASYGIKIAPLPVELIGVTPDTDEILFVRADGKLVVSDPDGVASTVLELHPELVLSPAPHTWMWSDRQAEGAHGTLTVYGAGTKAVAAITDQVATDFFLLSPSGDDGIFFAAWREQGAAETSTRTGDLSIAHYDGTAQRTLVSDVHLGRWDGGALRHTGPCSADGVFPSDDRALVLVCIGEDSESRTLIALDLDRSTSTTIAADLSSFIRLGTDQSFALFLDHDLNMFGVSAAGDQIVPLAESERISSLVFLDGKRFAYVTSTQALKVASWPDLVPYTIVPFGVDALEAASPTGAHAIFRQNRSTAGLRDLWLVSTATASTPLVLNSMTDGYPGDDAFSTDGAWVRWFSGADSNFIGDVFTRPVIDARAPIQLAPRAWYVLNYADTDRVLLMANASVSTESRKIIADLASRAKDGSDPLRVLASGIDPTAFALFSDQRRIVFRVAEGAASGLWVRPLDER